MQSDIIYTNFYISSKERWCVTKKKRWHFILHDMHSMELESFLHPLYIDLYKLKENIQYKYMMCQYIYIYELSKKY